MYIITIRIYNKEQQLWERSFASDTVSNSPTEITIGRSVSDGHTYTIPDTNISRSHLKIRIFRGNVFAADMGSTNGVFLNSRNQKIANTLTSISDKDTLFLGNTTYKVCIRIETGQETLIPNPVQPEIVQNTPPISQTINNYFQNKNTIWIGRDVECDIVLKTLTVSRRHAKIEKINDQQYIVTDHSSNGTFVNKKRIRGSATITHQDVVLIADTEFRFSKSAVQSIKITQNTELSIEAYQLEKEYPNKNGNGKVLGLRNVSIIVKKAEFVAVMGPSGCGKSTLLKSLNGESFYTNGVAKLLGENVKENYEYLKQFIGYVPQDDIVHKNLTVQESLYFSAKLRLTSDITDEEIDQKITTILADLNLDTPTDLRTKKIAELSGGQRKRVSIATELLTDPKILFLDEPTSPLDPETIEGFLEVLKNLAQQKETTIFMVTHKPDDLYFADRIIFLAKGGYLTFVGLPNKLTEYFGKQKVSEIYAINKTEQDGQFWAKKWQQQHPIIPIQRSIAKKREKKNTSPSIRQWWWLTKRYWQIKMSDGVATAILVGQAPIIALLMCLIFKELTLSVLFFATVCAIWFGTSNAAKEIVDELPIYKRERMFNLQLLPYILSKITVLTIFSFIQTILFAIILHVKFNVLFPDDNTNIDIPFLPFANIMLLITFSGTLMGLLISTIFDTSEKVMTFLPLILIPQIMLSGVVAPIEHEPIKSIAYTQVARWGVDIFAMQIDTIKFYKPNHVEIESICNTNTCPNACQSMSSENTDTLQSQQNKTAYIYANDTTDVYLPIAATQSLNVTDIFTNKITTEDNTKALKIKLLIIAFINTIVLLNIILFLRKKDPI